MFSPQIVGSDEFLEMPTSSRELYFQLGMYADDDGFISPRKIMRMVNATDDDLKVLIGKRFVLPFETGVVVIKHWMVNNLVRKDWYQETRYTEQKERLFLKPNKAYTLDPDQGEPLAAPTRQHLVNGSATEVRLGKVRLGKVTDTDEYSDEFIAFWSSYPKKTGKGDAWRSWNKIAPSQSLAEKITASVADHVARDDQWKRERGRFIPNPATFLNQRRWEDEIATENSSAGTFTKYENGERIQYRGGKIISKEKLH